MITIIKTSKGRILYNESIKFPKIIRIFSKFSKLLVEISYEFIATFRRKEMDYFLCEVFDVPQPLSIKNLDKLFDIEDKKLLYGRLYKHPHLLFNLTFHFIWENCFGVSPGKIDVFSSCTQGIKGLNEILNDASVFTPNLRLQLCQMILDYIFKCTFFTYVPKNTPNLPEASDVMKRAHLYFEKVCESHDEAEKALKQKLTKRLFPFVGFIVSQSCEPKLVEPNLEDFMHKLFVEDQTTNVKIENGEKINQTQTSYAFYTCLLEYVAFFIPLEDNDKNTYKCSLPKRFYDLTSKHTFLYFIFSHHKKHIYKFYIVRIDTKT